MVELKLNYGITKTKEKQVNTFLTIFIGEDIHRPTGDGRTVYEHAVERFTCVCGKSYGHKKSLQTHIQRNNRNFYQPNDFDRLRKWMEANEPELWDKYLGTCVDNAFEEDWMLHRDRLGYIEALNAQLNPTNLYEFLKERRLEKSK